MIGGHGHVRPRPDGARARCGGPGLCGACSSEQAALSRTNESDIRSLLKKFANHKPDCHCFICRNLSDDERALLRRILGESE